MAKYLLGGSVALILATGGLSLVTKTKVEELQTDILNTKTTLKTTRQTLKETKDSLAKGEAELKEKADKIAECEADITKRKGEIEDLNKSLAAAKEEPAKKAAEIEVLTKKVAELEAAATTTSPVAPAALDELKTTIEKLKTEVAEAKQVQATMEESKKTAEEKLVGSERTVAEYKQGYVNNGLSGKVLAYNPGWNFVVLSIGDKQGLKSSAQMLVMRGNKAIAKARVTTVEPSQSIADILPGSLQRGETVMPGDTVVYEIKNDRKH